MPPQPQKPLNTPVTGRAVVSWPTPVIHDNIITEYVSAEVGKYAPAVYGTRWDALEHGAFQEDYPDFELVFQTPADVNGWFIRRIWCNPRINQQTHNYSIQYAEENPDYPIITRLTVVKRSEYTPTAPLTPDVDYPGALLVQERLLNQTTPEEINSLYVTIATVYETLPGPIVTSYDFDPNLNIDVTTKRQVVLSSDIFDPTTVPLLMQMSESPQSEYKKLRAYSYLEELPEDFTEESTGTYNFPTLVFGVNLSLYQLTTSPERSEVYWSFDKQDAPQVPALLRTTTSFSDGEPSGETLFALPLQNLFYRGVSYQIAINGVLNNETSVSAVFVGDARYGDLEENYTFFATTLSATDYQSSYIGTYQIIGCDIKRYRGNIYVKRVTSSLMA